MHAHRHTHTHLYLHIHFKWHTHTHTHSYTYIYIHFKRQSLTETFSCPNTDRSLIFNAVNCDGHIGVKQILSETQYTVKKIHRST